MGRYLGRHRIELVHSFDVPMNLFGAPVARLFQTPKVLSSQRAHRSLTPGFTRHLLRVTDQMVDAIVVNCQAMRKHLVEDEEVPDGRIRLCYNGVDSCEFHPSAETRLADRDASVVVGIVCALRPEKGLFTLLEAFRQLSATHERAELRIVGEGPLRPELEARSRALGIGERCLFEPATARVADTLRSMDIFVLPSFSEALSNSLMEAMACGCAAVASRVGGNPELVRHGENGLLFESGDAEQLAARLRDLIGNPPLRSRLAAAGSRFIRERFSLAAAARRMGEVYEEFLAARQQAPRET
jgi:glycosyltransferase involved in cell wall biosynthesis